MLPRPSCASLLSVHSSSQPPEARSGGGSTEAETCHPPTGRPPQAPEIRPPNLLLSENSQKQEKQGLQPSLSPSQALEALPRMAKLS